MVTMAFPVMGLVVGAAFLFVGVGARNTRRHRSQRGTVVDGVVVGHSWERVGHAHRMRSAHAFPEVEFVDHRGRTRRFVHQAGSDLRPEEGRRVRVRYDPDEEDFQPAIEGEAIQTALPVVLMVTGGFAILLSLLVLGVVLA